MQLVLTQEGAIANWNVLLGAAPAPGLKVHLLGSNYNPVHTSTQALFLAAELAVAGYAPITLSSSGGGWTILPIAPGAQATNQVPSWTFGGACTVYGGWLELAAIGRSWFGWAFDTPFTFGPGGGPFFAVLSPTLISQP